MYGICIHVLLFALSSADVELNLNEQFRDLIKESGRSKFELGEKLRLNVYENVVLLAIYFMLSAFRVFDN